MEYPTWLDTADNERVQHSIRCLKFLGLAGLVSDMDLLLAEYSIDHTQLFLERPAALKTVEQCMDLYKSSIKANIPPDDLSVTHSFASLCYILGLCFHQAGQHTIADKYAVLHEKLLLEFLLQCENQTTVICNVVRTVKTFLDGLSGKPERVILTEMPSGNSLIVELLRHSLAPMYSVEVLIAALSRDNPKRLGISRKELLKEQLEGLKLKNNDIVIYADEWLSGANFKTVSEFLHSLLPIGAFFLPVACLSVKAQSYERFESFCKKHDALIQKNWGVDGSLFRVLFPKLNSRNTQLPFFWAENDRMAGYRKMQFHGTMFSTLDQILNNLRNDKEQLRIAASIYAATRKDQHQVSIEDEHLVSGIMFSFEKWHDDYLQIREDLKTCAEEMGRGGLVENFDLDLFSPGSKYEALLRERDAGLAYMIALRFMSRLGPADPADRYYFEDEAPHLVPLKSYAALQHIITMNFLREQYDSYNS